MSRADPEAANSRDASVSDREEGPTTVFGRSRYPPPPGPNQAFHGSSNFVDGSGPLFSMYVERATEYDRRMTNSWKGDADGILVFTYQTGLFSAAVASLAAVSVQDLRPSSQDTSAFYLANIYQLLAAANGTHVLFHPLSWIPSLRSLRPHMPSG
ncbi:hypothetical protein BC826DRAFT_1109760 [Russula brevipes]|nr:hypothetical protein BC826DRAFT_1109760 [Russula brevipes]